jgi:hypothetical protein
MDGTASLGRTTLQMESPIELAISAKGGFNDAENIDDEYGVVVCKLHILVVLVPSQLPSPSISLLPLPLLSQSPLPLSPSVPYLMQMYLSGVNRLWVQNTAGKLVLEIGSYWLPSVYHSFRCADCNCQYNDQEAL